MSSSHILSFHGTARNCRAQVWSHVRSDYARYFDLASIVCYFLSCLFATHTHLPSVIHLFPVTMSNWAAKGWEDKCFPVTLWKSVEAALNMAVSCQLKLNGPLVDYLETSKRQVEVGRAHK